MPGGGHGEAEASQDSSTTSMHVMALDEVVNVNSLFTAAVFIGLSLSNPNSSTASSGGSCTAGTDIIRDLIVFEVVAFSCFLFSSMVAQGLKLALNLLNSNIRDDVFRAHINSAVLRLGMLASAAGSVVGCGFLLLSIVHIIQVKLGLLSCSIEPAVRAVAALVVLVGSALLLYVYTVFYAFMK